jgi:hypothetical protein
MLLTLGSVYMYGSLGYPRIGTLLDLFVCWHSGYKALLITI